MCHGSNKNSYCIPFLQPSGPGVSLYLTLFGIVAGFLSTFWTFGYVRLGRKLRAYVDAGPAAAAQRIKKSDVLARLERGVWINVMGLGATLLGLQVRQGTWHDFCNPVRLL